MPVALRLGKEEVDSPEKRANFTIVVIGCGKKGVRYALAFAEAGYKVICADSDQSVIKRLARGGCLMGDRRSESKLRSRFKSNQITATGDIKNAVGKANVIIITVNAKLDSKKSPNRSALEGVCKQVGACLPKGSLVVYAGSAGFGFAGEALKDILENTSGLKTEEDFGLAYIPLLKPHMELVDLATLEMVVAANDKYSLNSTAVIFETLSQTIKKVTGIREAELAYLFASAKRDTDAALANELAMLCETANVDYAQTKTLLASGGWQGTVSPCIGEEENRKEAYLLLEGAENLNTKLKLCSIARQINEEMIKHALNLTQDALRSEGKTLRRARVAILGNVELEAASGLFIELLEAKGAKVTRYQPNGVAEQSGNPCPAKKTLNETVEAADCLIVLSEQEQFKRLNLKKLRAIMKSPAAIVDLAGVLEPSKVEAGGFVYRGLGRGVWKK